MKHKRLVFLLVLLLFLAVPMTYKVAAGNAVREETYAFLESKGYTREDLSQVEIKHSFLNRLLSYNEWRIFVTFRSEPDITFAFTRRNGEILRQGVSSASLLDKETILEYERKFDNGEFQLPQA